MNKKLLSLIVAYLLPMALQAGPGDVNGDDTIDVADIVAILNHLDNKPTSKFDANEADMNFDGSVDLYDVELLAQKIMYGEYIYTDKKEYHLVNQGDRYLNIPTYSSIDYLLTGGYTYKIDCEGNWLRYQDHCIQYDNNWTGKDREAKIVISTVNYPEITGTVKVIQHSATLANTSRSITTTVSPKGGILEIPIIGNTDLEVKCDFYDYDYRNGEPKAIPSYLHRMEDEIRGNDRIIRFNVDANESNEARYCVDAFYIKVGDGSEERFRFVQVGKNAPTFEEQKEALIALYNSTNGDNWKNNTNWLSDKPVNQWFGVNNDIWAEDTIVGDYILRLQLIDNQLIGTIPEKFSAFLYAPDINDYLSISHSTNLHLNGLYGKIPEAVKNTPRWDEAGWDILTQNPYYSSGRLFDYDDSHLSLSNDKVTLFVDNEESTVNDIISKNELTLIYNRGSSDGTLRLSNLFVNHFLDYCNNNRYGMVLTHMHGEGWNTDGTVSLVNELRDKGFPKEIEWAFEPFGTKFHNTEIGSMFLVDKQGRLIQYWGSDCTFKDQWYIHQLDSVCRARLGEPQDHEPYVSNYYTSSDYSKDGEVTELQSASVENGIDIVFLGECYVDTDMEPDGIYERTMTEAMEQFFAEEPFKSMRYHFNVYAVKAISPNAIYDSGTNLAIGGDIEKAFEYAKKAVGNRDDRLMVGVICKPGAITERSRTFMFEGDGSFAAWMFEGVTPVINHEMGGHGVAFLLDEYIEPGMQDKSPDEDSKTWLDNIYEQYGEGANVDWRSNPSEVKWAHFINDARYAAEKIGVYEGSWLYGHGAYRPTENSMMRYNDCGFNAPSREAIYKRVMKLSEGDSWTYDYETFVEFDTPAREAYKAAQSRSMSRGTETQQKRRIESRPPTIYKGTWRDAGKYDKIELFKK